MNPFYIAAVACWLWPLSVCHSHVVRWNLYGARTATF